MQIFFFSNLFLLIHILVSESVWLKSSRKIWREITLKSDQWNQTIGTYLSFLYYAGDYFPAFMSFVKKLSWWKDYSHLSKNLGSWNESPSQS